MSRALPLPVLLAGAVLLMLPGCRKATDAAQAVPQIHIAGSSAAFPFSAAAAERLMREEPSVLAPLVRAGGSGAAIAEFCDRPGPTRPDIVVLIRPMTPAEATRCAANARTPTLDTPIGRTALVLVTAHGGPAPDLTRAALYRVLTTPTAHRWADIDPRLPALPIRIEGPAADPAVSDGLFDLLLAPGCAAVEGADCTTIRVRRDGAYVGHGADADGIAHAVATMPGAVGILPYAQAFAHRDTLDWLPLDGVRPSPATVADGRYPAGATLHLIAGPAMPGLARLLAFYADGLATDGSFAHIGLIALPPAARTDATGPLRRFGQP
jgi:phosphate transport system substrate-binding protein